MMWEVQENVWWNHKDRARRQLIWLMERFLGDNNEEAAFGEIPSRKKEEREDGYVGRRYAD
jgi:hypothetical protein